VKLAETAPAEALRQAFAAKWVAYDRDDVVNRIFRLTAQANPELAVKLLEDAKGVNRAQIRECIADAWAGKNPEAALVWVRSLPSSETNDKVAENVLRIWAKTDLDGALEAVIGMDAGVRKGRVVAELLRAWMRESPDASAEWVRTQPDLDPRVRMAAIESLAGSHPLLVAGLLSGPMTRDERRDYTMKLVAAWSQRDPAAAWAWLNTQPHGYAFYGAASVLMEKMAATAPGAALVAWQALPEGDARDRVAGAIARGMTDKGAALIWLSSLPDTRGVRDGIDGLIAAMNLKEPAAILALLDKVPPGRGQLQIYSTAARTWLEADPQGAIRWMKTLKDQDVLKTAGSSIGYRWAEQSPTEMASFVSTMHQGPAFDTLVGQLSANWGRSDAAAAVTWLAGLPDSEAVRAGMSKAFHGLGETNPSLAREKLESMPAGALRARALSGAVEGMASIQPEQGARFLLAVATPAEQPVAVERLIEKWMEVDRDKAVAWTSALSAGEARDRGLITIMPLMGRENPQQALALVNLASTDSAKLELAGAAILSWYRQDSRAALTALGALSLTAGQKATIQRRCAEDY
jgi:hypothetical protein